MKSQKKIEYCIGIDEVGRGPIAGPVTIGAFLVSKEKLAAFKKECRKRKIKDSKQLSEEKRESWFKYFSSEKKANKHIHFVTVSLSPKQIDEKGIGWCIKNAIRKALYRLDKKPEACEIKLDGLLKAPDKFINQRTIVKGDEKEVLIAAASIVAKVTRDRYMCRLAKRHPEYCFESNKGYGSKVHRAAVKKHGVTKYHRMSFLRKQESS